MEMEFDGAELFATFHALLAADLDYKYGGKTSASQQKILPGLLDQKISGIDCSGFAEYVVARCSRKKYNIPSGSSRQRSWMRKNGIVELEPGKGQKPADVYKAEASKNDDTLRIAFRDTIAKRDADGNVVKNDAGRTVKTQIGHVWFIINGKTYESAGRGLGGPVSQDWNLRTKDCDDIFVLGKAPGFGFTKMSFDFLKKAGEGIMDAIH